VRFLTSMPDAHFALRPGASASRAIMRCLVAVLSGVCQRFSSRFRGQSAIVVSIATISSAEPTRRAILRESACAISHANRHIEEARSKFSHSHRRNQQGARYPSTVSPIRSNATLCRVCSRSRSVPLVLVPLDALLYPYLYPHTVGRANRRLAFNRARGKWNY
jgi:hypothetical protein